jgi:hypothetical protein
MAANQTANFVVKAKDAATGPLGKVGSSMGKLRRTAGTVFKGIATAAIAAGAALLAFAFNAVKAAADDEKQTIRLNAALKARGFQLDQLAPKIDDQIKAMQALGFTDDQVRDGLEVGSRFFKNQEQLLAANATAANIAAATGMELSDVMTALGRGAAGSTRGLLKLGIQVEKGAKLKDILRIADEKYLGVAEEVANSTSGKFAAAQIRFNEAIESFGAKLLPMLNEALTFLTETALPAFESLMEDLGPIFTDLLDNFVRPLVDSFGELAAVFESASGGVSVLEAALFPLKVLLTAIKVVIDGIVAGIKFIQGFGGAAALAAGSAARDYQTGGYARGDMGGQSSYLNTSQGQGTYVFPISIGTGKVDTVVADSIRRIGPGPRRGR